MRFIRQPFLELILPSNAGPNDPQTIIGPIIKAQLVAYYAPDLVVSNFIFQAQQNVFNYMCQVVPELNNPFTAFGSVGFDISDQAFIQESWRVPILASGDGGAPFISGFPVQIATTIAPIQAYSGIEVIQGGLAVIDGTVDFASPEPFFVNSPTEVSNSFEFDGISAARSYLDMQYATVGGLPASSTGSEVAFPTASWTSGEPTYTFLDGMIYKIKAQCAPHNSSNNQAFGIYSIRKGSQSTTGTLYGVAYAQLPANFGGQGYSKEMTVYVKNDSGSDVSTTLSLTVWRTAGTGNASIYGGDASAPTYILPRCLGAISDHPNLEAVAVQA